MFDLDKEKLEKISSGFQVPAKPAILTELNTLMEDEDVSIRRVAQLIEKDVGLSASILKIINSPSFGFNRTISEIEQAVIFLGLETIQTLATYLLLKESIKGQACISLERFWDDAMEVAQAMRFIGECCKNKVPKDMLYTVGLFHDCGIPLMAIKYQDYKETLMESNKREILLTKVEESRYKTNHAVIGYYVAASWNLPKNLCQVILRHHDSCYLGNMSESQEEIAYAVLKMAQNIVENHKRFGSIPEWISVKDKVLNTLGISEEEYCDIEDDYISFSCDNEAA